MDIVIAAAGKGTRLHDVTTAPKHIIPIRGRPFITYLLDAVFAAHFRRVIVVGGYGFRELAAAVKRFGREHEMVLVDQMKKLGKERYGTACPLLACVDLIQGDRFVYTMGDQLLSARDLEHMQQSTRDMLVAVAEHEEPQRYGVVEYMSEGTIARIVEKPARPTSQDINVGLYTLTSAIFPILRDLPSSARNEYEMTDVINAIAQTQTVRPVRLQDPWMDLGRPEDIQALERFLAV